MRRAWLRAALGLEGTRPRRAAQPQARAPASVLAECRASLPVRPGRMLSAFLAAGRHRPTGRGAEANPTALLPEEPQARHLLTKVARKTGKRRIHQKPMLPWLVQHLQGGRSHLSAPRPPRPAPQSPGISSVTRERKKMITRDPHPGLQVCSPPMAPGQRYPLPAPQNWLPPRRHCQHQERGARPLSSRSSSHSLDVLEQTLHHGPGDDEQHGGACRGRPLWSKLPLPAPHPPPRRPTHPSRCPGRG